MLKSLLIGKKLGLAIVLILFASSCDTGGESAQEELPNIVIIMADDLGYSDISSYGGEIPTPGLDRLSDNGLRFSQFYNTARCAPTRASLLTGLYPAQTGLGFMTADDNIPGYRGEISKNTVTIAEVLKQGGYKNYMAGKWHIARNWGGPDSLKYNWPLQRGFDKFYGTIGGANSYWDPLSLVRGNNLISPFDDPGYQPEDTYYYTDAITDHSLRYLDEHEESFGEDPFFMYIAHLAPHWPLHAPEDEIARHEGKYDAGYAPIRQQRYENLIASELIDEKWELTEQEALWDTVSNKDWHARNMEAYAAMITRMDKGIEQLINKLEEQGELDNTIIMFLSDNGGNLETLGFFNVENEFDSIPDNPVYEPMAPYVLQENMIPRQTRDGYPVNVMGKEVMAGSDKSYHAYGPYWANVSNTPFREYKHYIQEGGVATPFIFHWPKEIQETGIRHQPAHVIDIMATLLEITGLEYPTTYNNNSIVPLAGQSLTEVITKDQPLDRETIYFEHEGNRGLIQNNWKLVSKAYDWAGFLQKTDTLAFDQWRLYDIEMDRTETNDLSDERLEMVKELSDKWYTWALETNTIPKPK